MSRALTLLAFLVAGTAAAFGQASPAPAAAGNVVRNGDFLKATAQENLWDGVDGAGFLSGNQKGAFAVSEAGKPGSVPMPISVSFVDMNGDGLPDLATADPMGYFRVHFNSGTKTEPKFTHAEMVPLFLARIAKDEEYSYLWGHGTPKISVYDMSRRGALDLIVGNYAGEILKITNTGGAAAPVFSQPAVYEKITVPTSKSNQLWGNLFAPCAVDWNKDGKTDLLVGEGSYSANAVHLLLNQASSSEPKWTEEDRYYLCYGDGREQLVPTVADYNGDGAVDVLVGDRKGTVGVHLAPSGWKPGDELPLATMIKFGNTQALGSAIAPYAADYNGDDLFDLLIGKTNGRIAVAINKGTKTEPKFDAPTEIKGVNLWANNIRIPTLWTFDTGDARANLYSYISVTEEASPDGGKVLKAGYFPSPNKVIKMVPLSVNGSEYNVFFDEWASKWHAVGAEKAGSTQVSEAFVLRQTMEKFKPGAYNLSFKVRGKRVKGGMCTVAALAVSEKAPAKVEKGERGAAKITKDEAAEQMKSEHPFSAGSAWAVINKAVQISLKKSELKDAPTTAIIEFKFELPQYDGECEIADVKLVAK